MEKGNIITDHVCYLSNSTGSKYFAGHLLVVQRSDNKTLKLTNII